MLLDLQELQVIAQLVDNMNILSDKLEKAYSSNDAESFNNAKQEILKIQGKINQIISRGDK
jgi:hypothetical protein